MTSQPALQPAPLVQALATLAQAADPSAWALVLEQTGPAMEALARRLTGDGELARDAVQEALLQIRDNAGSFHPPATNADRAAHSWVLRVTANTALALLRSQARRHRRERLAITQNTSSSTQMDDQSINELTDCMRIELAHLPEPTRAAIVLHHCSGLSFSDVAATLGIPEGTAKVRVNRGVNLLRERLMRAGYACSLLTVCGLLKQASASELLVSYTNTAPAHQLLTTMTKSSVPFLQQGFFMTTTTTCGVAATALLISSIGIFMSNNEVAAETSQPSNTPAPISTAPKTATVISPQSFTTDPYVVRKVTEATGLLPEDVGPTRTWKDQFIKLINHDRNIPINLKMSLEIIPLATLGKPCPIPVGTSWNTTFDALAKDAGLAWRIRGEHIEFIPRAIADSIFAPLDGHNVPSGTRTQIIAWFAWYAGLTIKLHTSLGVDDGKQFTWAAQTATNEAWLDGLAVALQATARLNFDGTVLLHKRPAIAPLDNDPEFLTTAPQLVYQPTQARLDDLISLHFEDVTFAQFIKTMEPLLHYPITIDPKVDSLGEITLQVTEMKIRDVLSFIVKLSGLNYQVLPDRLNFYRPEQQPLPLPEGANFVDDEHASF